MNFLKLAILTPILMLAFSFSPVLTANDSFDNWRELGRVKAGHNGDHDRITIDGPSDTFRKIKFRVTGSPLIMNKMVVVYDDKSAPENIDVRNEIPKDGESRVIDLKGGKRRLKSVEFWFETKGFMNGKAEVTLYGQK